MSAGVKRATKTSIEHIATFTGRTGQQQPTRKDFLTFRYETRPRPINITTFPVTELAFRESAHPLHTKVRRRLAAFNANLLHWSVRIPASLSKNAIVRGWAAKRVREAVRLELQVRGSANDGTPLDGAVNATPLKGAVVIQVSKPQDLLLASGSEVRQETSRILDQVIGKCRHSESLSSNRQQRKGIFR